MMKNKEKIPSVDNFDPDGPILKVDEDELNRDNFVLRIVSAIKNWDSRKSSIVIGLYGEWGSGKSSVINMIKHEFAPTDSNKTKKVSNIKIVEFNPWRWSGVDNLFRLFFDKILIGLEKVSNIAEARRLKQIILVLQEKSLKSTTISSFSVFVKYGILLVVTVLIITGIIQSVSPLFRSISAVLAIIILIFQSIGKTFNDYAKLLNIKVKNFEKDLDELRDEIIDFLKENAVKNPDKKILFIIDDIDRLSSKEIKTLFQLIKANADFPNVIYLLAFQRDIVEISLGSQFDSGDGDTHSDAGKKYLDKIIQIDFNIPKIDEVLLSEYLKKRLKKISSEYNQYYQDGRFELLYSRGIRKYFSNLREVKRYINSLNFHVGAFKIKGTFEINLVDLFALEAIRKFEPEVYHYIYEMKHLLVETDRILSSEPDRKESEMEFIKRLIKLCKHKCTLQVFHTMFPEFENQINTGSSFNVFYMHEYDGDQHSFSRINTTENFEKYFQIAIPPNSISNKVVNNILDNMTNNKIVKSVLKIHINNDLLPLLLIKLKNILTEKIYQKDIKLKDLEQFLLHLVVFSGGINRDIVNNCKNFFWQIARSVKNAYSDSEADKLFEFVSNKYDNYEFLVSIFHTEDHERNNKNVRVLILTDSAFDKLRNNLTDKIEIMAKQSNFLDRKGLNEILFVWKRAASDGTVENWMNKDIDSIEKFLKIVSMFKDEKLKTKFNIGGLEKIIDLTTISTKITHFKGKDIDSNDAKILNDLADSIKKYKVSKRDAS